MGENKKRLLQWLKQKYKSLATQLLQSWRKRHIIAKGFQSGSKKKEIWSINAEPPPKNNSHEAADKKLDSAEVAPFFVFFFLKSCCFPSVTGANISYKFWSVWANPNCILWPLALLGDAVSSDELGATEKVMTCTMLRVEPNNKSCFGGNWAVRVRLGSPESQYLRDPPPLPAPFNRERINWWYSVEDKWN